jgi:hypothetical protein
MCEALRKIKQRFDRELAASRGSELERVLLLVSDGESTDGSPVELAKDIQASGATIIGAEGSRAFVQANHSEVLRELVALALSPVESGYKLLPKGQ